MIVAPLTPALAPAWDAFVLAHPESMFWHRSGWLFYEAAREGAEFMSAAIMDRGAIVAVVPGIAEGGAVQAAGEPVAGPLTSGVSITVIMPEILSSLRDVGITLARFRGRPTLTPPTVPDGYRDISWKTEVLDLSPAEDELFHGLRKSYRSGATDVRKLAQKATVVTGGSLDDFRAVHEAFWIRESGAPALNDVQWSYIAGWLDDGTALLYGVPGQAYVLVYIWKGWAYYASGPSLAPNLNALLQWTAIRDLKARGVRYYELGWHAREGEDEKHRQIAFFKTGFGSQAWIQPAWEWRA